MLWFVDIVTETERVTEMERKQILLRIAYQPYKWLIFGPWLVLSTLIFGAVALLLVPLAGPRATSRICGRTWARMNGRLTPMSVAVTGRENVDPRQSYVIVCNHQSQYDIFVLYGWLDIDFRWVLKQELRKIPALGAACDRIGHIFIDRSNHEKALASINAAKERIRDGTSVLFFPEGSRSSDGRLRPFKKGAFKMAVDMDLPLLPVTIIGTKDILPNKTIDLFPGRATMIIHPPMNIAGYNDASLPRLMDQARHVIASALPPEQRDG